MMTIDKHTVALVSIIGSSIDVLGALYLAYDLLGGEHGPLRTLTRAVTYGALFGTGFGLALGPVFGMVTGVTHGVTLALEFSRASRRRPNPGFWYDSAMSSIRGAGFGLGAAYLYGWAFGATFATLSAAGQILGYQAGMRPTMDYNPGTRPRLTRRQARGVLNRTVGYAVTGYLGSLAAGQLEHPFAVGLKTGLVVGVVTAVVSACMPFVEWNADHLPEKRMGVIGVALIVVGFAMQSVQYWLALLDVSVR